jgi:hypothetical protein
LWLGCIPFCIGLLFELLIVIPLRVPIDETPSHNVYQDWTLGLILLKLWTRIVLLGPFEDEDPLLGGVAANDDGDGRLDAAPNGGALDADGAGEDPERNMNLLIGGGGEDDEVEGIYTDRYWQREFELVHEGGIMGFRLRRILRQIIMPIRELSPRLACRTHPLIEPRDRWRMSSN